MKTGRTRRRRCGSRFERSAVGVCPGAARRAKPEELDADRVPVMRDILDDRSGPGRAWDAAVAVLPDAVLGDALLDRTLFPGLGDKVENEAMFRARVNPLDTVAAIPRERGLGLLPGGRSRAPRRRLPSERPEAAGAQLHRGGSRGPWAFQRVSGRGPRASAARASPSRRWVVQPSSGVEESAA